MDFSIEPFRERTQYEVDMRFKYLTPLEQRDNLIRSKKKDRDNNLVYSWDASYSYNRFDGLYGTISSKTTARRTGQKVGTKLSNWRTLVQKGANASTAYRLDFVSKGEQTPIQTKLSKLWLGGGGGGVLQFSSLTDNSWSNAAFNNSLQSLRSTDVGLDSDPLASMKRKLSSVNVEFKSLVPLGEIKETMHIVRSVNSTTINLLHALIDIKRLRLRDAARIASDTWLQYSFGVSPLIADVKQLCNTIADRLVEPPPNPLLSFHSRARLIESRLVNSYDYYDPVGSKYRVRCAVQTIYKVQYSVGLKPYLRNSSEYRLSDQFGTTLGDVLPAVWELVPYSWVVDYVTNIGDVISDLFWSPPGNTVYICKTKTQTDYHTDTCVLVTPVSGSQIVSATPGFHSYRHINVERSLLGSLPHAQARIRSFDEVAHHGLNKMLNLASVLLK